MSLKTPSLCVFIISFSIYFIESTGDIFQPVGHVHKTSTKLNPKPFIWFSNARLIDFFVFIMLLGLYIPSLATYAAPSHKATISDILIGYPKVFGSLPWGVVVVFCPMILVALACPPVMQKFALF